MKKFTIILALLIPSFAFAYIDPVTGSAIIQGLVAGLAFLVVFFKKVKQFFKSLIKKIFRLK